MKLLFDENLSFRLVDRLRADYPGAMHVDQAGLRGMSDHRVWQYARENGYTLVSKDDDFRNLCFVHGAPPKVVWLNLGNAPTSRIAELLTKRKSEVEAFVAESEGSLFILRDA